MDAKVPLMKYGNKNGGVNLLLFTITATTIYYLCRWLLPPPPSFSHPLSPSLTSRLKSAVSAVSARSSVHSQGVLRAGSFLETLLMDWPDIPSK